MVLHNDLFIILNDSRKAFKELINSNSFDLSTHSTGERTLFDRGSQTKTPIHSSYMKLTCDQQLSNAPSTMHGINLARGFKIIDA